MIRRTLHALLVLSTLLVGLTPAAAQFADQATYAGASSGTNAVVITIPNVSTLADLRGVLIKFTAGGTNTAATTLAVSGTAATAVLKPTSSGLVALTGGELQTGQSAVVMYDGTQYVLLSAINANTSASNLSNSALGFSSPTNLQLNATVSANNLLIAVKGNNGADPSASNPVLIPFRDPTIASGDPVIRSLTAALSFQINSTNTMGCTSAVACRLWILAIDNAGSVALCAFNASSATSSTVSLYGLNEQTLATSASGTNGGSSAGVLYCSTSAVSSKAFRIMGYLEATEATAGTWATNPTYVQLFGPGVKKPGDVVQDFWVQNGANTSTANTYTTSNTAPVPANGAIAASAPSFTATSPANIVQVDGKVAIGNTSSINATSFIHNGTVTLATSPCGTAVGTSVAGCSVFWSGVAGTGAVTYVLYYTGSSGTTAINGQNAIPYFGGTGNTYIRVREFMGALQPDNDDAALGATG